jgi:hypothetical protein
MGAKHTPGPWTINRTSERHGQRPYGISAGKRGPTPKNIVNWGGMAAPASQESEANARLIASAPDLLEALRQLLGNAIIARHQLKNTEDASLVGSALWDTIGQAEEVIRKATGEAA